MGKLVVFFFYVIGVGISLTDKEIYIAHGQIFEIRIFYWVNQVEEGKSNEFTAIRKLLFCKKIFASDPILNVTWMECVSWGLMVTKVDCPQDTISHLGWLTCFSGVYLSLYFLSGGQQGQSPWADGKKKNKIKLP